MRHIATDGGPRSVESVGGPLAVVAHTTRGTVSIVDARQVRGVIEGFEEPRYTAAHPNGWLAYVTDSKRGDVAVVRVRPVRGWLHASRRRSSRTTWLRTRRAPRLGDVRAQNARAIYDLHTRERLATFHADAPPQHVTFARGMAFVTSGDDGTLRVHRLDGRLLRTTRVPVGSYSVQQAWGRVLTPSLEQGTVCVLDERGALLHRERVARSSHDAAFVLA